MSQLYDDRIGGRRGDGRGTDGDARRAAAQLDQRAGQFDPRHPGLTGFQHRIRAHAAIGHSSAGAGFHGDHARSGGEVVPKLQEPLHAGVEAEGDRQAPIRQRCIDRAATPAGGNLATGQTRRAGLRTERKQRGTVKGQARAVSH